MFKTLLQIFVTIIKIIESLLFNIYLDTIFLTYFY